MSLWFVLGVSALTQVLILVTADANERFVREMNAINKRKFRTSKTNALLLILGTAAVPALWTWHAFAAEDWRFAAVAWLPIVANVMLRVAVPKYGEVT